MQGFVRTTLRKQVGVNMVNIKKASKTCFTIDCVQIFAHFEMFAVNKPCE